MYEGEGTQYYDDGSLHYKGNFHENLYTGEGKLYRPNGSLEYDGQFAFNMKEGQGTLYDFGHNALFTGQFSLDDIKYSDLIGKKATEIASAYGGKLTLYETVTEKVRYMPDISAMTLEYLSPDSIDTEATVEGVFVILPCHRPVAVLQAMFSKSEKEPCLRITAARKIWMWPAFHRKTDIYTAII